jgi:hypothetical protein
MACLRATPPRSITTIGRKPSQITRKPTLPEIPGNRNRSPVFLQIPIRPRPPFQSDPGHPPKQKGGTRERRSFRGSVSTWVQCCPVAIDGGDTDADGETFHAAGTLGSTSAFLGREPAPVDPGTVGVGRSAVQDYLARAAADGLVWPLPPLSTDVNALTVVLLQLFAASGSRYNPCHGETATSGSGAAGSILQGAAVHR